MTRRLAVVPMPAVLACVLASGISSADTIYLKSGGRLHSLSWRITGDRLILETASGTVGIQRSDVIGIDIASGEAPKTSRAATGPNASEAPTLRPQPLGAALPHAAGSSSPADAAGSIAASPTAGQPDAATRSIVFSPAARLTLRGHEAFRRGDYDGALSLYSQALADSPGFLPAAVSAASAALAKGDPSAAAERARVAIAIDDASSEAWAALSQALYAQDKLDEAQSAIVRSLSLHERPDRRALLEKLNREREASSHLEAFSTPHFRVLYDGSSIPRLGGEALKFLEDEFDVMAAAFRHYPSGSFTVILYPKGSFHEATGADWSVGGLFDGKLRIPLGGPDRLGEAMKRVLRHELTHGFVDSKTNGNCPRWLHEGLAQRAEPRTARGREGRILEKLGDHADLRNDSLDYDSALSLVEHIVSRHGEQSLLNLLDRLGEGASLEQACRFALSTSTTGLLADWRGELSRRADNPRRSNAEIAEDAREK